MSFLPSKYSAIIITGGSSGIGYELTRSSLNITHPIPVCNLSRTIPPEISDNPALTHFPCDLSDPLSVQNCMPKILDWLQNTAPKGPILLINNSGFGTYGNFTTLDKSRELEMIQVNISSLVELTSRLLPSLINRGGSIVNIASLAAFQPTPYLSTYGATKAFLLHWGLSLSQELKEHRIHVLTVCPGPTKTQFFKNAGFKKPILPDGSGMRVEVVASEILNAIEKRKTLLVPGFKNKLIAAFAPKLPKVFLAKLSGYILKKIRLKASQSE